MKFLSVVFLGSMFFVGTQGGVFAGGCSGSSCPPSGYSQYKTISTSQGSYGGGCSGGSCLPLTKKLNKAIKESENDTKRQAWMKQRESYWKGVYAKNAAMQRQQQVTRRR